MWPTKQALLGLAGLGSIVLLAYLGRVRRLAEKERRLARAKAVWRRSDAVCLDVDSTVIKEEGLDVLADYLGVGERVREITTLGMNGGLPFSESLSARVALLKLTASQLATVQSSNPFTVTNHVPQLLSVLRSRGVPVFLISGGFRQLLDPIAKQLGFADHYVFANTLLFDQNGLCVGFDPTLPTATTGGKAQVITNLITQFGFQRLVMIGDGATDMEACPPASAFIGFGGNVERPLVKQGADWYVYSFATLIESLDNFHDDDYYDHGLCDI